MDAVLEQDRALSAAFAAVRKREGRAVPEPTRHAADAFLAAAERLIPHSVAFSLARDEGDFLRQAQRSAEHFDAMRTFERTKSALAGHDPKMVEDIEALARAREQALIAQNRTPKADKTLAARR